MNVPFKNKTSVTMPGITTSIGVPFKNHTINWGSYWDRIKPDMAFLSDTFDYSTNQWLDQSGNDNHLNVLAPYYNANNAWGEDVTTFLSAFGFTTYHEFVYGGVHTQIFTLSSTTSGDKQMTLRASTGNVLSIFHRVKNTAVTGSTVLTIGQKYKVLVQWVSKDDVKVYLDGSSTPEINAASQDWAWQATWNKIGVNVYHNSGSKVYSTVGAVLETRIKAGTQTWATISDGLSAIYYHQFDTTASRTWDCSGNGRHLSLVGVLPTTKVYYQGVSPQLKNGYEICKRVSYGGTNYADIFLPYDNNGVSLFNTAIYPFRDSDLPTRDTEWKTIASIAAATTKYNGCDVKFAFPYNAMLATADGTLGALFTGTTPNQLDPYSLWDDHLEKHIMFFNKGVVSKTISDAQNVNFHRNHTYEQILLEIDELAVFKTARTDHVNILRYLGYSSTPAAVTDGEIYRMVSANDSFKLASTHITASKFAGLWDLFYERDIADAPLKCRYSDIEKINGRNIFCDGTTLWIYPKPLLPSHFETALEEHLGITDLENIITTSDGITYYDIDYEKYTLTKDGAINLNPNATVATKYDIFDRRNVVGSAKEIWHADMVLGSAYWTWNLSSGVKKLYQPSVSKYIQATYSGKLFIRQDWDQWNNIICPYIIIFATPLTGATKTAMFEFIDFPETVNEPAIVGDGVTDDALAINTAMGSHAAVMLYEKTAKTQTSVAIPDNVELILADSTIFINNDINLNVIRNETLTGNENIKFTGYGVSVVDGNGTNQDRDAYLPITDSYNFIPVLFSTVSNLRVRGFENKDATEWGVNIQKCEYVLAEHIKFNHTGTQHNQDGLGLSFGTRYAIGRYLTGKTNDDFIPILNYFNEAPYGMVANSARRTEWNYYRNICQDKYTTTNALGAQVIRIFDNDNLGISNIEWQNIYHYYWSGTSWGNSISLILFSDWEFDHRSNPGTSYGFVFNNIRGSSTRNIRFLSGNYQDIVANIYLDDPNQITEDHILVQNHVLTNVEINSVLDYEPDEIYDYEGGTLTNFTHTEEINY